MPSYGEERRLQDGLVQALVVDKELFVHLMVDGCITRRNAVTSLIGVIQLLILFIKTN